MVKVDSGSCEYGERLKQVNTVPSLIGCNDYPPKGVEPSGSKRTTATKGYMVDEIVCST